MAGMCLCTEGELGQVDEALAAAVGCVIRQRLRHIMRFQTGFLHGRLHHGHGLHTGHGVEVTVHTHDISTWNRHQDIRSPSSADLML